MNVSVIIVNYNTRPLTQACIESIYEYTSGISFEVIVVDNASTDDSIERLSRDSRILLMKSPTNIGFGKANNLGYTKACGKYLFLLNSDTLLKNNAIKYFFDAAEKEPQIACWGTLLIDANGKEGISYGRFLSMWRDFYMQSVALPYSFIMKKRLRDKSYNYLDTINSDGTIVDYVSGADLFLRKEVADKYALFDPFYFLYCEETDMQKRYASNNLKSKIIKTPQIIHLEGGSQIKGTRNLTKPLIQLRSKMYYFHKWYNPMLFYTYLIAVTFVRVPFLLFSSYSIEYKRDYLRTMWRLDV